MWFGYLNRNWEETPDIPAGANNGFGAGSEDLGQPTHFLPRRQAFVFKVNVPADWPADKDLVWTLKANGVTNVNAPDGFRKTPLRVALDKGYEDVAAVLRNHGGRETL